MRTKFRPFKPRDFLTLFIVLSVCWLGARAQITPPPQPLADSVVLTTNYTTIQGGTALTLTAKVTPAVSPVTGAEAFPAGTVSFYDGATLLGVSTLYSAGGSSDASLTTVTTSTLPAGQDTLTAVYSGDAVYAKGTSNAITVSVQDFSITPSASNPAENLNINQGSAGQASFLIGGMGGFNGLVQVICTVPAQDDMTCTASPQQVSPGSTVTFVVQTFATGVVAQREGPRPLWPRATGGTSLAAVGIFLLPFSRSVRRQLTAHASRITTNALIFCVLLIGLSAVGIGCTSTGGLATSGTPLGVATLKITASAYVDNTVVSHSVYLTVDVLAPGVTAP